MTVEEQLAALTAQVSDLAEKMGEVMAGTSAPAETTPPAEPAVSEDEPPGWFRKLFKSNKPEPEPEPAAAEPANPDPAPEPAAATPAAEPTKTAEAAVLEAMAAKIAQLEAQANRVSSTDRSRALADLGVTKDYHEFAPDVDLTTDEGRAALEQWVVDHPAVAPNRREPPPKMDIDSLPEIEYGPSKEEMQAQIARAASQDWRVM